MAPINQKSAFCFAPPCHPDADRTVAAQLSMALHRGARSALFAPGNVTGEELRMGLHDLGFKLSDVSPT